MLVQEPDLSGLTAFMGAYWDAMARADELPFGSILDGTGFLYVVGLSTEVVKVGQTTQPRKRIKSHVHGAAPYGVDVLDIWVSDEIGDYAIAESALIQAMAARYGVGFAGIEYFRAPFNEAVEIARRIIAAATQ